MGSLRRDLCWVTILVYHGLDDDTERLAHHPLDIHPAHCLAEIRQLESQGYRLICAEDLDGLMRRPRPGGHLLVSFDDAHLGTFEPLQTMLKEEQVPVLVAVCPGVVSRRRSAAGIYWWEEARVRFAATSRSSLTFTVEGATWQCGRDGIDDFERRCLADAGRRRQWMRQLRQQTAEVSAGEVRCSQRVHSNMGWRELAALDEHSHCTIAAHSLFHDAADSLSTAALRRDALACRRRLAAELGKASDHFVYPNGAHDETTERQLAACGFRHTYTVIGATNPLSSPSRASRHGKRRRWHRFHGFGYDPGHHQAYADQYRQRHRALLCQEGDPR